MKTPLSLKLFLIIVGFLAVGIKAKAQQDWTSIGPSETDQPTAGEKAEEARITAHNGTLYFYYADGLNNGKISVRKFVGNKWEYVGNAAFAADASNLVLVFDPSGTPFIAYSDYEEEKVWVKKLVNSVWEDVGATAVANVPSESVSMVIDGTGKPYVAFYNRSWSGDDMKKISVFTLNGEQWQEVESASLSADRATSVSLAINSTNIPYIAFRDNDTQKGVVKKLTITGWELVGGAFVATNKLNNFSIAISGDDVPYLAYKNTDVGDRPYVLKFDGSVWQEVASASLSAISGSRFLNLTFDGNTPYLSLKGTVNMDDMLMMKKLNTITEQWDDVAEDAVAYTWYISAFESTIVNGVPCAFYQDGGDFPTATFKKVNETEWQNMEMAKPLGDARIDAIIINGELYTLEDQSGVYLKKFNGTNWEQVGNRLSKNDDAQFMRIHHSQNGIYVSGLINTFELKKLVDGSWEDIPTEDFEDVDMWDYTLEFYNGKPYIAYKHMSDGIQMLELKKLNDAGTGWEDVGQYSEVYRGEIGSFSLSFDQTGKPFVLLNTSEDYDKARTTLITLTGNSWTEINNTEFDNARNALYAFSATGEPYMTYLETDPDTSQQKIKVMKFNGTAWEAVGNANFSSNEMGYPALTFASDNSVYLFYADDNEKGKGRVMHYNMATNNWETVGASLPTVSRTSYGLIHANANTLFLLYEASDSWWLKKIDLPTSVLPVSLIEFTAKADGNNAKLQWKTASEVNSRQFTVYRSGDDNRFVKIGEVTSATPNAVRQTQYTFTDKAPLNGNNYYKLIQVDNDGKTNDLGVRTVTFNFQLPTFNLYPNPTTDKLTITFEQSKYNKLELINLNGKLLQQVDLNPIESNKEIYLSTYPNGVYLLKLSGNGKAESKKVIKK